MKSNENNFSVQRLAELWATNELGNQIKFAWKLPEIFSTPLDRQNEVFYLVWKIELNNFSPRGTIR